MPLERYIQPVHRSTVLTHLALVTGLIGLTDLPPALFAVAVGEYRHAVFFGGLGLALAALGFTLYRRRETSARELQLKDGLVVTALSYLLFGLVNAFAFLPVMPLLDGFFEAMSGFTTTGLTVMDVASAPRTLLFFRSYSQWIGGLGIIIISLAILMRPGKAVFQLYSTEYGQENIKGSVIATARIVTRIYLVLTGLGLAAFMLSGMSFPDALIHILSTLPTGGFSSYPGSIGHFQGTAIPLVVCLFMALGAISFPLYYRLARKDLKGLWSDMQVRGFFALLLAGAALFFVLFGPLRPRAVPALFQAVSSLTTTGYNMFDVRVLSPTGKVLTIVLMTVGGTTGSTAGGIKIFRLLAVLAMVRWLVLRALLPGEARLPLAIGRLKPADDDIRILSAFLCAYMIMLGLSAFALLWIEGSSFLDALFETSSAMGTVGLSTGLTSPDLSPWAKLILILNMWMGRLEIIPVLVVFYPRTWLRW
jgi:trk system potassium uptake protein TrkH